MYDIAIIGAGPAGSTLARLLGKAFKVALVEKRDMLSHHSPREKCCGGLLAPDAQKIMAKLSLGLPGEILSGPQLFCVCALDLDNHRKRFYRRHYINMDRQAFDRWLITLVPPEVDLFSGHALKRFENTGGRYSLQLKTKGASNSIQAAMVVGADGAFSKVRSALSKKATPAQRYIAAQEWHPINTQPDPCFYAIFDSQVTDFYSWIIPKENGLVLGSALHPKDNVSERFDLLKKKLVGHGIDLISPYKKNGAYLLRPRKLADLNPGEGGIALVGEAAGFISPSSGEGLSYAMKSAVLLAESLKEDACGWMRLYRKKICGIKCDIVLKNLKSRLIYHSGARGLIMKSGLMSLGRIQGRN